MGNNDSEKRKVLSDEELEQVSGGRSFFHYDYSPQKEDPCAQWKDRGICDEKYDCNCIWDWGKNKCISFTPQE